MIILLYRSPARLLAKRSVDHGNYTINLVFAEVCLFFGAGDGIGHVLSSALTLVFTASARLFCSGPRGGNVLATTPEVSRKTSQCTWSIRKHPSFSEYPRSIDLLTKSSRHFRDNGYTLKYYNAEMARILLSS